MRHHLAALLVCMVASAMTITTSATTHQSCSKDLGSFTQVLISGIAVDAEVADESAEIRRGLMNRQSLAKDAGMLFIYPKARVLRFWMKNTYIPLDIAFADKKGRIVKIRSMEPESTRMIDSKVPAKYALEMNQGWYKTNGINVGDTIECRSPAS